MFFVQPAHIIMILAVTLVAASMLPNNIKRTSNINGEIKPRSFVNFVYLAAFCTHVGAQFWMTFISGELIDGGKSKTIYKPKTTINDNRQTANNMYNVVSLTEWYTWYRTNYNIIVTIYIYIYMLSYHR